MTTLPIVPAVARGVRQAAHAAVWVLAVLGPLSCDSSSDSPPISDPPAALQPGCYGASYEGMPASQVDCGILPSLGNPTLDFQSQQEYQIQVVFWGLQPSVYAFSDCTSPNAISMPAGVILFGVNLAHALIVQTGSTLPLAGVLAHEWAHQVQFYYGWYDTSGPTVAPSELEADAFSGFYVGLAKSWAGSQMNAYYQTLFNLGSYNFNDPGFHGTPNMRLAAGLVGLMEATYVLNGGRQKTYAELHAIFATAVEEIMECDGFCSDPLSPVSAMLGLRTRLRSLRLSWSDLEFIQAFAAGRVSLADYPAPPSYEGDRRSLYPR